MKWATLLTSLGHEVLDVGAYNDSPSDYPDFAELVGNAVIDGRAERGLLICGSGVGASVAANKLRGIRAGMVTDTYSAHQGVEHDNINVLVLGSRVTGEKRGRRNGARLSWARNSPTKSATSAASPRSRPSKTSMSRKS